MNENTLIPLSTIEDSITINDLNYLFTYKRIKNPDENQTDLFSVHYKNETDEQWITCNSLLTSIFTIAKTEDVINEIRNNLEGDIENERHYRSGPSIKSVFKLSGYQIDIDNEDDVDRVLFKLLTNIDADISLLTTADLTFNVINGFAGTHALQLNFGLLKTIRTDNAEHIIPINNIFLLDKYTVKLIHDNHLSINIQNVTDVQQQISNQINNYKRVQLHDTAIEQISRRLPKKMFKKFVGMMENVPENLKNFYYGSYILSSMLEVERRIPLEIKLRTFITDYIDNEIKRLDRASE